MQLRLPSKRGYLGNPNLKQVGEQIEFTQDTVIEYARCAKDPIYFLENYGKIVALGQGVIPFKLFVYQKRIIKALQENRKVIGRIGRQMGKSTIVAGYYAWFCLFNKNTTSAILANKLAVAKEIFSRVQFILENCPKWLQQGIKEWNKTSLELENGARVFCSATSPSAVRGFSCDNIFCDEFAHLNSNLAEEFIASVFPTLSSSKTSRLIIVSTPKGLNHYWKIWDEAEKGLNGFKTVQATWDENPNRDDEWLKGQLAELGELKFRQEVLTDFLGSSDTLISGHKVASLSRAIGKSLLPNNNSLLQYFEPEDRHSYVMTVDTSRGKNLDYSAFTVIDITTVPYKIVCTYRNNLIQTLVYPEVIEKIAKMYNDAFVLIETNDLGQQVADILFYDLEYENIYMSKNDNIKEGGGGGAKPGLRTTKKTKAVGCDMLKDLIENDKLEVNDSETISELSTFVRVGSTYKAEDGKHDDMVMCLVMFAYLTTQTVFKELFDFSLREKFFESQLKDIDDQMLPLGFFDRGEVIEEISYSPRGWVEGNDDTFNF